jgi:hypothetical protein
MEKLAGMAPASGLAIAIEEHVAELRASVDAELTSPAIRTLRRHDESTVDRIVERYEQGAGGKTLAKEFGIPRSTVYYHLRRRGIERRPPSVSWKHPGPFPRPCETCGAEFTPTGYSVAKGWGRFCSRTCKGVGERVADSEERTCARKGCSKRFMPTPSEAVRPGHGQFCSRECRQLHFWRADEGARVTSFVSSLEERGLFKGGGRQRWHGRWSGAKPPAPGAPPRGRPRVLLSVEQRAAIGKLAALGWGRRAIASRLGVSEHVVRQVLADSEA